jgi:hypothetical protein
VAALLGLGYVSDARAELLLDLASVAGANVEFLGSGTGASFEFNNNGLGQGFQITLSSGFGDSVGLYGTLGGTYSYTTASIVTLGPLQTAPLITSGGLLTIVDAASTALTGTIAGVDVSTVGTGGLVNVNGAINLTGVSYAGTNLDLIQLRDESVYKGVLAISFQFIPGKSLTDLAAHCAVNETSYSGSIYTAVPEPSSLALAGLGALGMFGYGLRRRMSQRQGV